MQQKEKAGRVFPGMRLVRMATLARYLLPMVLALWRERLHLKAKKRK